MKHTAQIATLHISATYVGIIIAATAMIFTAALNVESGVAKIAMAWMDAAMEVVRIMCAKAVVNAPNFVPTDACSVGGAKMTEHAPAVMRSSVSNALKAPVFAQCV